MVHLLDVNVLVALVWEQHLHHVAARRWFGAHADGGWATCSVTQMGFVRVSSNTRVLADAIPVPEATAVLSALVGHPAHRVLTDSDGFVGNPAVPHELLVGHRQVTDAHLIGLARAHDARVATFDRGMWALADDTVVIIDP